MTDNINTSNINRIAARGSRLDIASRRAIVASVWNDYRIGARMLSDEEEGFRVTAAILRRGPGNWVVCIGPIILQRTFPTKESAASFLFDTSASGPVTMLGREIG